MFNTKSVDYIPLNATNILNIVPEEEIYKRYLGFDFETGKCYNSILRKDSTPSLNFYYNAHGALCYKDFGHSQGNVFEFVKNLFRCSYFEALQRINYDFNLNLGNSQEMVVERPKFNTVKLNREIKNTLIQVKIQRYTEQDLKYWESNGITISTLRLYKVFSVSEVYLNKKLRFVYTEDNPIYAFLFNNNKIKIYRPFSTLKWLNNADASVLQGIEQLPETGDLLIITKSLKDVMLFKELGYSAIAPQGESMAFDFKVIEELKTRFTKIIVVYDNDDPGVRYSIKLTSTLNLGYWNIPSKYKEKDPTDFYRAYGKEATINLLNTIKSK